MTIITKIKLTDKRGEGYSRATVGVGEWKRMGGSKGHILEIIITN